MTLPPEGRPRRRAASPTQIGVRAAAIFAPLGGAIAFVGTLDATVALVSTAVSALLAGGFFAASASLAGRHRPEER